jgi:hypothetical protein
MDRRVENLLEAVEAIDAVPDGELIAALVQVKDRLDATLTRAFTQFVAEGRNEVEGWRSPVSWLRAHCPLTDSQAKGLTHTARRMEAWPTLAELWSSGDVNEAQVETVVRSVAKQNAALFAEHDTEVSPMLVGLSVADTRAAIRDWNAKAEALTSPDPALLEDNVQVDGRLDLSRTLGDRVRLDGDLDPDIGTLVDDALQLFERPADDGSGLTATQRRVEALGRMARFALDHHPTRRRRHARRHPHVDVTIDVLDLQADMLHGLGIRTVHDLERFLEWRPVSAVEEGLLRTALDVGTGRPRTRDGHRLTPEAITTIFGTGTLLSRLLLADGQVLDQGRDVRFVQANLRDAMLVRDMGCRFPGCDAPVAWIDGHHIRPWERGGPTSLANAVALCASHHGMVHRTGWSTSVADDGTMRFVRPDGRTLTSPPPRARRVPRLPLHRPDGPATLRIPDVIGHDDEAPEAAPTQAAPGETPAAPAAATEPSWRVTRRQEDGLPVDGTAGHHRFRIEWDTRTPAERRSERETTCRRLVHLHRPPDPVAA